MFEHLETLSHARTENAFILDYRYKTRTREKLQIDDKLNDPKNNALLTANTFKIHMTIHMTFTPFRY